MIRSFLACVAPIVISAASAVEPPLVIENVVVVDVVAGRVTEPRTVIITDRRISAIGDPATTVIPPAAVRVEGNCRFLTPGLVDMHVHLFNNASHRPPNDWALPLFVANGVTGVREMRSEISDLATIEGWRRAVEKRELIAPRILAAGVAVRGDSPDAARRDVRKAATAGAAFIKIFSEVPESHWRAILEEARALSIPVSGHVPTEVSALTAAKAGQRSNEHLTQLYEACSSKEKQFLAAHHGQRGNDALKLRDAQERDVLESFDAVACVETAKALAKTGQVQVPTLTLSHFEARGARKRFRDDPRWSSLRKDEQTRWERIIEQEPPGIEQVAIRRWEVSRDIVRAMSDARVRILAGTDAPMPLVYPGSSLHKEMELLVESGLSPADALRAATIWSAEFLGLSDNSGSVAVGKRADLLLLDGNPLLDIKNTQRIRIVFLDGRVVNREQLDGMLAGY